MTKKIKQSTQPSSRKEILAKLFNDNLPFEKGQERELILEQYILYVETMDKVSERRHSANSFFLSVNTLLVSALATLISLTKQSNIQYGWLIIAAMAGIFFCWTWYRLIRSYRQLNHAKFMIIHLIETRLPVRLFDAEWDALNHGDGTIYKTFSSTEKLVPFVFIIVYAVMIFILVLENL
jgi:hypothetical protein